MLTAARSLALSAKSSPELPHIPELEALYKKGCRPRRGNVIMIAGRSGSQKSGFALWLSLRWNLPTLYLSADMSSWQASVRLACSKLAMTTDEVEQLWANGGRDRELVVNALADVNVTFSFGTITYQGVDDELEAYLELHDEYPQVIVVDNLMDVEGAEADYSIQMEVMQWVTELSRETGATVLVLHHASDKSWDAKSDPWSPPSRTEVKGGMSEKPELSLSVALEPQANAFRIAVIKQRMGPSDPTARDFAVLTADPETTRFLKYTQPTLSMPQIVASI